MHGLAELTTSIKDIVVKEGLELWSLEIGSDDNLLVYVDKPGGITIEECSKVSRRVRALLEENPNNDFRVEVSSPGLERSLKTEEHFQRSIGMNISCQYKADGQNQRQVGLLEAVDSKGIKLRVEAVTLDILFEQINKVRRVAL